MASDDENSRPILEWKLRVSNRARYAKLQIKPFGGLEVIIPPRFPRAQIPRLVERHAHWAQQQLERQSRLRDAVRLPHCLSLAFDGSSTPVVYRSDPTQLDLDLLGEPGAEGIIIHGDDEQTRSRELRNWIRRRARQLFPSMLETVAADCALKFNRLSIRSQKTRWGSCSIQGNINLNDQLLFVPPKTVEYLMIHELCHTRHLNHSRSFWRLVEEHCPDYRDHEALLSNSRSLVPDWFLRDIYR